MCPWRKITINESIDTALEEMKLGAYDYLTKQCEIDELVARIEGAWGKKGRCAKGGYSRKNPESSGVPFISLKPVWQKEIQEVKRF